MDPTKTFRTVIIGGAALVLGANVATQPSGGVVSEAHAHTHKAVKKAMGASPVHHETRAKKAPKQHETRYKKK